MPSPSDTYVSLVFILMVAVTSLILLMATAFAFNVIYDLTFAHKEGHTVAELIICVVADIFAYAINFICRRLLKGVLAH